MERDWRDEKIAEQAETIAKLTQQLEAALARIAKLEEKTTRSSRNSSQPPSSDGPAVPPPPKKPPTGRKPGGQGGHQRHSRPLVPLADVDEHVVLVPERCRKCTARLFGKDAAPGRHQVFELPEIKPHVTEYALHTLTCRCGTRTTATLPRGVRASIFGCRVIATVAMLMGVFRLSKRAAAHLMGDLFGLPMSVGAVVGCQRIASHALQTPYVEAKQAVAAEPVKNADETPWKEARKQAWLWCVVTANVTVFMIHARRHTDAAKALLGNAFGILGSDRHGGYNYWPDATHQFCWAHLIRDFTAMSERGGESEKIGKCLLEEAKRMFALWHRVRDGTLARSTFQVQMRSVREWVHKFLLLGKADVHPTTSKTCANLLKHERALWTFVRVQGVEPTNNSGERAVRHAVLYRKTSFGTHSADGSRFVERILTVHATLRQQKRRVLDFIEHACHAALMNTAPPSLLPSSTELPLRAALAA